MASTFTNISSGSLSVTDENGLVIRFEAGETKTSQSDYLYIYTAAHMSPPVLSIDTSVPTTLPVATYRNENAVVQPGATNRATKVRSTDTDPGDLSTYPARSQRIVFDTQSEGSGDLNPATPRQIKTAHLGLKDGTTSAPTSSSPEGTYVDTTNGRVSVVKDSTLVTVAAPSLANYATGGAKTITAAQCSGRVFTAIAAVASTTTTQIAIPAASGVVTGSVLVFIKTAGTGIVTITPASGNINGGASYTALDAAGDSAMFVSDGTDWVKAVSTVA